MIETIRVSEKGRDQLLKLKRVTKIKHWNVLCRWAVCVSLAERTPPPDVPSGPDSNVEMGWKTFGGPHAEIYWALIKQWCLANGLPTDDDTVSHQFKLHLHRGIGYLAGDPNLNSLQALLSLPLRDFEG